MSLLEINDLAVSFQTITKRVHAVNGISFGLNAGEILGIVGESGSGKSQMAFAILGLLSKNATVSGEVIYGGRNVLDCSEQEFCALRSTEISMVFQNPMLALNPYMRVSEQMAEIVTHHQGLSKSQALKACVEMLDAVQIPDARRRARQFPHEFSGGMRQRILIAMALLCRPKVLIADEPTTALDVTVQAQIVELLKSARDDYGTSIMLITHDLGLVAGMSDRIAVMYGGQIMESGPTDSVFAAPAHPYTAALLDAVPRFDRQADELSVIPGEPLDAGSMPNGCPFEPRCEYRMPACATERPEAEIAGARMRACFASVETIQA